MRSVRYQVASSLDGYIAGPSGEYDWIVPEPEIDFEELFAQFDTLLMGRHTFEMLTEGFADKEIVVVSNSLRQEDHPGVTIASGDLRATVEELRRRPGNDIWLFGGGELFRSMLELDLVDTVELAVIPILLGGGIPFLPSPAALRSLRLAGHRAYGKSGIVMLTYDVVRARKKSD